MDLDKLKQKATSGLRHRVRKVLKARERVIDRYLLEDVIFTQLIADPAIHDVLFIGCAPYTRDYPERFASKHLQTIDIDPANAPFGSADHLVASFCDIDQFVAAESFDVIVCNGVIGFGLNDLPSAERAFVAAHKVLRPGGWLIYGWNEDLSYRPFPPEEITSLRQFETAVLPPFDEVRHKTYSPLRHVFDFYRKPASASTVRSADTAA